MSTTETLPTTYDKSAILRARRLGAWGPGVITKAEGLWETAVGTYIVAERTAETSQVSYRLASTDEAAQLLEAHGHAWRARHILEAEEAAHAEPTEGEAAASEAIDGD